MDFDNQINRAAVILAFMAPKEAAVVLADAGVPADEAFLAIKAAEILVAQASPEEDVSWYADDDGDYLDRGYTGRVFT